MQREDQVRRLAEARVGSIATVRPDGSPHVVPFVFVVMTKGDELRIYWAVDDKPKRRPYLQRLANLTVNPIVEVEVNGYDEDWRKLWWVRASGNAREVASKDERKAALAALAAKYPQYAEHPPSGPLVAIDAARLTGWAAS